MDTSRKWQGYWLYADLDFWVVTIRGRLQVRMLLCVASCGSYVFASACIAARLPSAIACGQFCRPDNSEWPNEMRP